jgi:O-antigen/teichoic acid export membrane protein
MVGTLFMGVQLQGTHFILGAVLGPELTGLYWWGYALSAQAPFLISASLLKVFFPTFARLNEEPERQYGGFLGAARALTMLVAPVCLAQMLAARPLISLLFHERWLPAVPVVVWLSAGLLTQPVGVLADSVLMARGRYRALALLKVLAGAAAAAAAVVGALSGSVAETALLIGACMFFRNLMLGLAAVRELGRGAAGLAAAAVPPLLLVVPAAGAGILAGGAARASGPLAELLAACGAVGVVYGGLILLFMRRTAKGLLQRATSAVGNAGEEVSLARSKQTDS